MTKQATDAVEVVNSVHLEVALRPQHVAHKDLKDTSAAAIATR